MELNTRQWKLYNLLKANGDCYMKQRDISAALPEYYGEMGKNGYHDSPARLQITADIRFINQSGVIQKIILSNKNGVKLSNETEFNRAMRAEFGAIFRRLARARQKAGKADKDGQCRLVLKSERDFIEAFIPAQEARND